MLKTVLSGLLILVSSALYGQQVSEESLEQAKQVLHDAVKSGRAAGGTHMVWCKGQTLYLESAGLSDIDDKTPMNDDAIVRIYSMSKPITSVAAMILMEQGKFDLDDSVAKYIPAFQHATVFKNVAGEEKSEPPKRPISIRDLLRHTSGYSYAGGSPQRQSHYSRGKMAYRAPQATLPPDMTIEAAANVLAKIPAHHHPGERFTYGYSTDLLGRLVEVWSGQSLDEYLSESVLKPLEMNDTGFSVPVDRRHRFAALHTKKSGKLLVLDKASSSPYNDGFAFLSGGGGLVSTIGDYANFCQMLVSDGKFKDKQILKKSTLELMFTNQLEEVKGDFRFGLGFAINDIQIGNGAKERTGKEYSWGGYASTDFRIVPEEDCFQIFMQQQVPSKHGLAKELFPIVYTGME